MSREDVTSKQKKKTPPSIQNEERSTSFPVDPHVLTEKNPHFSKTARSKGKADKGHIHVIREQMRQHSGRQMYTHTTKEEQTRSIKHSQFHKNRKEEKKLTRTESISSSQTWLRRNSVVPI